MGAFTEDPSLVTAPVEQPLRARRRWLRFSLRTLMIGITLFCLAAGNVSSKAMRQKRAVERLKALRAVAVYYDYQLDDKLKPHPVEPAAPGPNWLRSLIGVDYFATVSFVGVNVGTDEFLEAAGDLSHLRNVRIACDSKISDRAWKNLKGLTELESLYLRGIDDIGMANLSGLLQLRTLHVDSPGVTDAGLASLKGLNGLRTLELWQTHASGAGVKELRSALPQCKISLR
jgi:hypothetical protein